MITYTRAKKYQHKYLFFFALLALISLQSKAQGDLLIYPKRVVFEGAKRSYTLNLANSGRDTVRYLISVVQVRMSAHGAFENITQPDPGQNFAIKYFRFFPRSIILAPNEAQSVKIQLVNTSELAPGEYRSHIYFRAEPDKRPLGEEAIAGDSTSISVNLVAVFGISIPVIIRIGESTTNVNLTDAEFELKEGSIPSLKITFNRSGNMSAYGDVAVDHISEQGKITRVGMAKGMALYTPNLFRHFKLTLDNNMGVDYHQGKLRITYTTQADAKSAKIAGTELELNNNSK